MDPNVWLVFIQKSLQSKETLSFLIIGIGLGAIPGFYIGRLFSIRFDPSGASRNATTHGLGSPESEAIGNPGPRPPTSGETRSLSNPRQDPVAEAMWLRIEAYLSTRGMNRSNIEQLKVSMRANRKEIINSTDRQRIMVWTDGASVYPVALLHTGGRNSLVLFPNGTDKKVLNSQLEDLSGKY
jgi:hypothetical protein